MARIKIAKIEHKNDVLNILDMFRDEVNSIINPDVDPEKSITAITKGSDIYENLIESKDFFCALAYSEDEPIGVINGNKIAQLRKGEFILEIEEMFVIPEFQGRGIAQELILAAESWCRENNLNTIRLESEVHLTRAHNFYEKFGFKHYGKGFIKSIN